MRNILKFLVCSALLTGPAFAIATLQAKYTVPKSSIEVEIVPQEIRTRKDLKEVPLNQIFSFQINILNASEVRTLKFDARMPGHDHGMIVTPKVQRLGQNRFYVEGVKLHMKGHWKMLVQFKEGKDWKDLSIGLDL